MDKRNDLSITYKKHLIESSYETLISNLNLKLTIEDFFIQKLLENKKVTKKKTFREYFISLNKAYKILQKNKLILDKVKNVYDLKLSIFEQSEDYYKLIGKTIYNLIKNSKSKAITALNKSFNKHKEELYELIKEGNDYKFIKSINCDKLNLYKLNTKDNKITFIKN